MLHAFKFIDCDANHSFLMDTQDQIVGGFSKWPDHTPGKTAWCMSAACLSLCHVKWVDSQAVETDLCCVVACHIQVGSLRPHCATTYVNAACCYWTSSVVCRSVTVVSRAEMAQPIKMPFGLRNQVSPRNHGLDGVQIPHGKGQFSGQKGSPL